MTALASAPVLVRTPTRTWAWWGLLIAVVVVAFGARLAYMLHTGGLLQASQYDDGVYYAAADAFVHGRLPYRDFLFLQPPGVVVAGAPFAWLGSLVGDPTGLIAARLGFIAVGAANTALVTIILRRFGYPAAAFGGFFYAIDYMAIYTERSVLLEPFGTLCLLLALVLHDRTGRWWLLVAGLFAGFSASFRIWNIVPALIIALWTPGMRRRLTVLIGGAAGLLLSYLPFYLAAPKAMFREVVLDQLGRNRESQTLLHKLHIILGDAISPGFGISTTELLGVLILLTAAAIVIASIRPGGRLYVALFAAGLAILLVSPSFFPHYTALTNPPLAIIVGIGFGSLAALLRRRVLRGALVVVAILGLAIVYVPAQRHSTGPTPPVKGLQEAAARTPGCIMTDDPSILPVMNVLSRDLKAGCPLWPDVTGWTYDADSERAHGVIVPRADNARWQSAVTRYLLSGQAVIQYRSGTGLTAESKARLRSGRLLFHDGTWRLYSTTD